jgi:hypothetical protein
VFGSEAYSFSSVWETIRKLEPERELEVYLSRNRDPGFTPGSTPDFPPGSGSNLIAVDRNQNT